MKVFGAKPQLNSTQWQRLGVSRQQTGKARPEGAGYKPIKSNKMAQSLSKLYVHIVFHIKSNSVLIGEDVEEELYAYMGSIINDNGSIPIIINGVKDHVHVMCVLSKNMALAKLVEEIKRHSSRWIKTKSKKYSKFAWQGGYGGFSVSPTLHEKTKNYIINQKEHHKTMTFEDEYRLFLKEYGIDFDEKYLFSD